MKRVIELIKNITYFDIEITENNYILLSTKKNCDRFVDVPSREDIKEAIRLENLLLNNFKNLRIEMDLQGNWVNLHIFKN